MIIIIECLHINQLQRYLTYYILSNYRMINRENVIAVGENLFLVNKTRADDSVSIIHTIRVYANIRIVLESANNGIILHETVNLEFVD